MPAYRPAPFHHRGRRAAALLVALALLAAACGGGDDDGGGGRSGGNGNGDGAAGEPVRGGKVVYGLENETSGGWCLPEAQLAIAGIQVARTVYDTLTVPNADGEYVPYLAKSVTPNDAFDVWKVTLRRGVQFHDGTDLDAQIVADNLNAYRGTYAKRSPLLFLFVYENVESIEATGPLEVTIRTKTPWPALPAYLYANGRVGIMARAQLDSRDCARNLIGTGPFEFEEWKVNDRFVAVRNESYWQEGLPYLDEIEYRPIIEGGQRTNALQGGEIDLLHTSEPLQVTSLRDLEAQGDVTLVEGDTYNELSYLLLNASKPPFDNINARKAVAYAVDRDAINEIRNQGILTTASGPFAPGSTGYLDDTGFPEFDLDQARDFVQRYEDETGQPLSFTITGNPDAESVETAQLWKQMFEDAGMQIDLKQVEQAQEINDAIAGNFQSDLWRNHPGGDPDLQYVWWKSDSPVNFGRIADPEIDRLLADGRAETDPEKRTALYEDLNRRFAEQVWNVWGFYVLWVVAASSDVHGILGPDLPDGSKPFPGLADGHAVTGLWLDR